MESQIGPSIQDSMKEILQVLGHLQIWPRNEVSRTRSIIDLCLVVYLMIFNGLLIVSGMLTVRDYYDLSSFAGHLNPLFLHCLGLFKWSYCIFYHGDIVELVKGMERCHSLCRRINKNDIGQHKYTLQLLKCRKHSMLFMTLWLSVAIGGVLQWCINPLIYDFYEEYYDGKLINSFAMRRLPYPGFLPWQINSIARYLISFVFQVCGGIASSVGVAIFDILNLTFMMYIAGQLDYLKIALLDNSETDNREYSEMDICELEDKLINCIGHHNEILIFLKRLENFSTGPVFIQCLMTIVALCLISFETSTIHFDGHIESTMKTIMMLEYGTSMMAELFLFCYIASEIGQLGIDVSNAIYSCNWERIYSGHLSDNQSKQIISNITTMIRFSIMRAQRPILITGGGLYILSLPTFKALVGIAASNAVILRQVTSDN